MRQRKKHLRCDATNRGDETRVAHACTLPVEAGWSLELPGDGRHGQGVQGFADREVAQAPKSFLSPEILESVPQKKVTSCT